MSMSAAPNKAATTLNAALSWPRQPNRLVLMFVKAMTTNKAPTLPKCCFGDDKMKSVYKQRPEASMREG